jgi:predicted CoA-binding protein
MMLDLRRLLAEAHTIAVVGLSTDETRPGHYIPRYLHDAGYRIIPVNPLVSEMWGERGVASLRELTELVDIVLVFRRADACPDVVRDALDLAHPPRLIWLQSGIISPEAEGLASAAGVAFVQNRCLMVEHRQLFH